MTRRQTLGLLALSLLASATWLIDDLLPVEGAPAAGEGFRLLLCSVLTFGLLASRRRAVFGVSRWRYMQVAIVSLGLIAIPFVLLTAARGRIASTDGVLVFALMPVATMLMMGGPGDEQDGLRSLPFALPGAAGVMILLPVRLPASGEEVLGMCLLAAAMLLSAACMVWLHLLLRGLSLGVAIPFICLVNGVALCVGAGAAGWIHWAPQMFWPHSIRAALFDLPEMILMVWLLKTISPPRLSSRYLIAPLFTVVEGLFLVRPHFDVRTLAGLGLLAVGAGMMMFARTTESGALRLNLQ